jgi:glyoxylase-like metal-dependent hydrolase (beta-lactamase superfamily II)
VVSDAAFIHDTLFMPDGGTARCDFPGGSARALWNTIQRILTLPDETRLFTGHDYMPGGREPRWESTVAGQKTENIHLKARFCSFCSDGLEQCAPVNYMGITEDCSCADRQNLNSIEF